MKQIINTTILLILAFTYTACEKVIDVELNEADAKLAIDAYLNNSDSMVKVTISQSGPYFESGNSKEIQNAVATLSDENGNTWDVPHTGNGVYKIKVKPVVNTEYTLRIDLDGQEYMATSRLLNVPNLGPMESQYQKANAFFDEGYLVYFTLQDEANVANYYRLKYSLNGVAQDQGSNLTVLNDDINDGGRFRFNISQSVFQSGDIIETELWHFDQTSYNYFKGLSDIVNSSGGPNGASAAPGNPTSNWTGNILGHFTAYSSSKAEIQIP